MALDSLLYQSMKWDSQGVTISDVLSSCEFKQPSVYMYSYETSLLEDQ